MYTIEPKQLSLARILVPSSIWSSISFSVQFGFFCILILKLQVLVVGSYERSGCSCIEAAACSFGNFAAWRC